MNKLILYTASIGLFGAAGYLLYSKLTNKATAAAKANRQIAGCKPDGCMLLSGLGTAGDVINFKVPIIEMGYYQPADRAMIASRINQIKTTYSTSINQAARLTNVPADVIASFIFIESNGIEYAVSGNAVGLMQIDPASMNDVIYLENKNNRLSEAEKAVIRKIIGSRLDAILRMKFMGDGATNLYNTDLLKPELNILLGAIYLGILIDEETSGTDLRMDKVVIRYNRGYFNRPGSGNYSALLASQPTTTANYILKLLGTNGAMDVLIT